MAPDDRVAVWQVLSTVVPIVLLWVAMAAVGQGSSQLLPLLFPLLVVMVLFLSRSFSLMHDCGHQSLFRSKRLNRAMGFALSLIHGMPQHPWSRGHAYHHQHNGNWDRYRGPSALITSEDFHALSPSQQRWYRRSRHPLVLIPGGFFYLIIKPRLALLLGSLGFIRHSAGQIAKGVRTGVWAGAGEIVRSYQSRHWYTAGEFIDMAANTAVVGLLWWWMGGHLGYGRFWILYSIAMSCSAAVMIAVFFIQHNFEGSYAHGNKNWSYLKGAINGSSFLQMPGILNWFTADIAYHHIHHLSERIPNYRLRDCHLANHHLLHDVHKLPLSEVANCFDLILWNRQALGLESIDSANQKTV